MKQFNLDEYLKNPNREIITRDGKRVKILCTDRKFDTFPIVALVKEGIEEHTYTYLPNGIYSITVESAYDLFFAPEKKEAWVNLYQTDNVLPNLGTLYDTKEKALENRLQMSKYISTVKIEWEE